MIRAFEGLSVIVFTIVFCHNIAIAQDYARDSVRHKIGYQIGVYFGPGPSYRTKVGINSFGDNQVTRLSETDIAIFGYSAGLTVEFEPVKRFTILTGICYSLAGYKQDERRPSGSNFYRDNYDEHSSLRKFESVEFPIKLGFKTSKGRVRFIAGAGAIVSYFVDAYWWDTRNITFGTNTSSRNEHTTKGTANLSPWITVGIDLRIAETVGVKVEPFFRHNVIDIFTSSNTNTYLWSSGIGVTFYYGR